jgi:curved DNA-binding protein CbpA
MADKFDPYHKWLGIPPRDQPPHHYRLLSIDLFESDREVIDAAARRLAVYVKSCATGPHQAEAKKLLAEIVQARLCLMDPQLRAAYDQRLAAPPPGAPPVEVAVEAVAEKPASAMPRRTKRAAKTGAIATAKPLADTPPPELPAPPVPVVNRVPPPPATDTPVEPPQPLADTLSDGLDTVAEMPTGITTLPEQAPRIRSRRSSGSKSGGNKSSANKSGAHQSAALAGVPLPGVKSKRHKRSQASPKVVMLILGGVLLAVGIVWAVFMKGGPEPEPAKETPKIAEAPAADEKPAPAVAAKRTEPDETPDEVADAEDAMFEDDDKPAKPVGATDEPEPTKGPAVPRSRANTAGLIEAVEGDGAAATVQKLIAAGADVSAKNKDGRTALRIAVIKGRVDLVKALLAAKANPNTADALGETPLMSAAKSGNEPIVKMLLEAGANPNVATALPLAPTK